MSDLIAVLALVICADGYGCQPGRDVEYLRQPDYDSCLRTLEAMPAQPALYQTEQAVAFTATCGLMTEEEYQDRAK